MFQVERRFTVASRKVTASARRIQGYAATFGAVANIGDQFNETIRRGAFSRSIKAKRDVLATINHDPNRIVGRCANGSLSLSEDATGLRFDCDVADTSTGNDLLALVRRQDLASCSFAFIVPPGGDVWSNVTDPETGKRQMLRTLVDVDLHDVSIVCSPAYASTSVSTDSAKEDDEIDDDDDDLDFLRSRRGLPLHLMLPSVPAGAPLEIRNRIQGALDTAAISPAERELRQRAVSWLRQAWPTPTV